MSSRKRKAFTILELTVVVVIMGILSATVIPAVTNLNRIREGAARDDIVRMIESIKGSASASGMPRGIMFDLNDSSITLYEIDSDGDMEIMFDPLTNSPRVLHISTMYSGVTITSFENGNGDTGTGVLWFDYESKPHIRDDGDGDFDELNTDTAVVTLSSGSQVQIHPHSGLVEVSP